MINAASVWNWLTSVHLQSTPSSEYLPLPWMAEVAHSRSVCCFLVSLGLVQHPVVPHFLSRSQRSDSGLKAFHGLAPPISFHPPLSDCSVPATGTSFVSLTMLDAFLPWGLALAIPQAAVSVLLPCFKSCLELIPSMRPGHSIHNFNLPSTAALLMPLTLLHFFFFTEL